MSCFMVASRRHGLELLRFAGLMIGCLPILGIAGNLVNQKLFSCGSVCDWHCLIFRFVGKNSENRVYLKHVWFMIKIAIGGNTIWDKFAWKSDWFFHHWGLNLNIPWHYPVPLRLTCLPWHGASWGHFPLRLPFRLLEMGMPWYALCLIYPYLSKNRHIRVNMED